MNSNQPMLQVTGLTCQYGQRIAVSNLSFEIRPGEVLGLIGPNGAGKSTVLQALSGLLEECSGDIVLNGNKMNDLPAHRRSRHGLGRSFQLDRAFWQLSLAESCFIGYVDGGREHVPFALRDKLRGVSSAWWGAAKRLVGSLEFEGGSSLRVGELSSGQLRVLSLMMLFSGVYGMLLLDEPFVGLSPDRRRWVRESLKAHSEKGGGAIVVDHALDEILKCSQRVILLDGGKLVDAGPTEGVFSKKTTLERYLGSRLLEDVDD